MNKWLGNVIYDSVRLNIETPVYNGSQRLLVCLEMALTWRKLVYDTQALLKFLPLCHRR